jgi:hypothetical protein
MLSLIPIPYRILAAVLVAVALFGGGFYYGYGSSQKKAKAELAKQREAQIAAINAQIKRADEATARLAQAEGRITVKTVEVIKRVPSVTHNVPCLSPAAVSLLQPAASDPTETPGKPDTKGSDAPAASDRDVAYWISSANQQYDTCAERLNALIDWHEAEK